MINYIIIEDELQAVTLLKSIVEAHYTDINFLGSFDKVSVAADFIKNNKIDFIFLDVQLNGELGIDIASYLQKDELNFEIIFTTAHNGFAIEAFALSALDYILKPIVPERLLEALQRVLKRKNNNHEQLKILQQLSANTLVEQIVLSNTENKYFIKTNNIIAIVADNVYCDFYINSNQKRITVSKPIKEYKLLLSNPNFFKTHRSYIINLDHVATYKKSEACITMKNDLEVKLSRDIKKEFEELMGF
jgi:two-component system, LytTR family, response regulator